MYTEICAQAKQARLIQQEDQDETGSSGEEDYQTASLPVQMTGDPMTRSILPAASGDESESELAAASRDLMGDMFFIVIPFLSVCCLFCFGECGHLYKYIAVNINCSSNQSMYKDREM